MDIDIKKDLTSNWFKLLQNAFCNDINELENNDTDPAHLKRNKIVSLLKKKFDFENSHLKSPNGKEKGILAKCFGYLAPDQAKELGIYPYFKEVGRCTIWRKA